MRKLASVTFALVCGWMALPAFAGIADGLNSIRREGCARQPGVSEPLRASRDLDAVAREWSKGGRLSDAFTRSDYRMTRSASMQIEGTSDQKAILNMVRLKYCDTITDSAFKEIGVYQRRDAMWIVVVALFVTFSVKDSAQVNQKVLALVNAARGKARKCGRTELKAVPPVKLSAMLNQAALIHSQDMARKNYFEHEGSDGSKVGDRVSRVGYKWRAVGENIAVGAETPESVVQGWIDSPHHCVNLMSPGFTEMGIAFSVDRKSEAGIYWTQVFAAPR